MNRYEDFAIHLSRLAGQVALPLFRSHLAEENKAGAGDFDPVTEADRGAEEAIRRAIAQEFPDHGVIGEEYGEDRPDAEFVWILDPIDGTRAFISGLPSWTTLIALRHQDEAVIGTIGQPYLDEIYIGGPSGGFVHARGQTQPLKTRPCPDLAQAVIATTDADIFVGQDRQAWTRLRAASRLARFGCDAYAYAMVAAGHMDMVAESELQLWDWSALKPVIEAAGGRFTDWQGNNPADGRVIAAGDPRLTEQAVRHLSPA